MKNKTYNKKKIFVVFICAAAIILALVGRPVYLMGFDAQYYQKKAEPFMRGSGRSRQPEGRSWMREAPSWLPIRRSAPSL